MFQSTHLNTTNGLGNTNKVDKTNTGGCLMLIAVKRTEDYKMKCDFCQQQFNTIVTVRPDVGNFKIFA